MKPRNYAALQLRVERILWGLALVLLPVTSFRYLPFFGDSQVKPISFLPVALLIPSILLRGYRQRRFIFGKPVILLLAAFLLISIISTAIGTLSAPPDLYRFTYASRSLRAWITLLVGLTFFIVPMVMVRNKEDLKFTLKWLYIGFLGHLVWSFAQWVEIHITGYIFEGFPLGNLVDSIQKAFSMAGITNTRRVSGLALEPSWLAAQVAVLYLPWVFAGIITGYSFSKKRWVSIVLLVPILILTILSYSRSGILVIILSAFLTLVIAGRDKLKAMTTWFFTPLHSLGGWRVKMAHVSLRLLILIGFLTFGAGSTYLLAQNQYFSAIWQARSANLVDYLVDIYAGPRLAFALGGWKVFTSHPWFGVGLGASGFYLHSALPDWSHFNLSETSLVFSPAHAIFPNIKNLYIRILAEVGIIGFWVWMALYLFVFSRILSLLRAKIKFIRFVAVAGLFIFFSTTFLNFTLDSFALPLIWFPLGIILGLQEDISQAAVD